MNESGLENVTHHRPDSFKGFEGRDTPEYIKELEAILDGSSEAAGYSGHSGVRPIPPAALEAFQKLPLSRKLEFTAYRLWSEYPSLGRRWRQAIAESDHANLEETLARMLQSDKNKDFTYALLEIAELLTISPGLTCNADLRAAIVRQASNVSDAVHTYVEEKVPRILAGMKCPGVGDAGR